MAVSDVAERVEERFKPVLRRISPRRQTPTERLKGAVESASGRLAEQAREGKETVAGITGRAGRSSPIERAGDLMPARFDSATTGEWGTRAGLLAAGLLLGFVLGWFVRAARARDDATDALPEEFGQAPAGMPRGSRFGSELPPSGSRA